MDNKRPQPPSIGWIATLLSFILIYLPLFSLIIYSFRSNSQPSFFTLKWYQEAFRDQTLMNAFWLSCWIALLSTFGATVLGTLAAISLHRFSFPGKKVFESLILLPILVPEIVFGLSLLVWFIFLQISLGTFSIILAHITFCLSYVILTVKARLHNFDDSLEEAGADLGATPWQIFWKITFPLIWPGVLSGALLAFTLSFDDFVTTYFTAGVGSDTLPVKLYSMIRYGLSPKVDAFSSIIFLATFVAVFLLFRPYQALRKISR